MCLRFRMYKFAFSADIVKMFRKKLVSEWPRNYGTSCAPFLAVRVLEHFAVDHQEEQLYFKNPTKGYLRR